MTIDLSGGRRKAFTLIELLVVIAIIGLLAALLVPVFQRVKAAGQATACVSGLRQIGVGLQGYLAEHDNLMPRLKAGREKLTDEGPVLDEVLERYVQEKKVFACPADTRCAAESGTSYIWNVAISGQKLSNLNFLGVIDQHSRIPLIGDKEGFHSYTDTKVNILYADGHATQDVKFFAGE
ncbi:MAG: hypothetical protein JWQ44_286 [Chthoniobacter sp.]|jgi:prepilin-type N-terminal cleavage/methylation domain-containing protein/prepilin-type processing-associated H-X9-DG protein|nr:hypothetical protein [Chthoniobacter sp.]